MPNVPYPYEVNGKLVTGNGSLISICFLLNCFLSPSLTVLIDFGRLKNGVPDIPAQDRNSMYFGFLPLLPKPISEKMAT